MAPTKIAFSDDDSSHKDDVMSIHVNRDTKEVFTGDYDGTIKKWSLEDLRLLNTWRAHPEGCPVYSLAGDDPGNLLYSSSCDGEIKQWDQKTGKFIQMTIVTGPFETESIVKCLAFNNGILYAGDDQGDILAYKKNFEPKAKKMTYGEVWSMAVDSSGESLFSVRDNDCVVSDLTMVYKKEEFSDTLAVKGSMIGRAPVAVNDTYVVLADRSGMNVNVYDSKQKEYPLLTTFKGGHDMIINTVCVGGSSETIYSSGWDTKVIRWNCQKAQKEEEYVCEKGYINYMTFGEDDRTLIIGGKGGLLEKIRY